MKLTIITPAHNEEEVIQNCLQSIQKMTVPEFITLEHIVVADRCTDRTIEICLDNYVKVVDKNWEGDAVDPVTEAVNLGLKKSSGELVAKIDADIIVPQNWLLGMLKHLDDETISVSSCVKSRTGKTGLDLIMWLRDINYKIAPLGSEPRGAARLFFRTCLQKIGGFKNYWGSWDTCLDHVIKGHGYKSKIVDDVTVIEFRPSLTITRLIKKQIKQGKSRKIIGVSLIRTLAHSIFRIRPFVIIGYIFF